MVIQGVKKRAKGDRDLLGGKSNFGGMVVSRDTRGNKNDF